MLLITPIITKKTNIKRSKARDPMVKVFWCQGYTCQFSVY